MKKFVAFLDSPKSRSEKKHKVLINRLGRKFKAFEERPKFDIHAFYLEFIGKMKISVEKGLSFNEWRNGKKDLKGPLGIGKKYQIAILNSILARAGARRITEAELRSYYNKIKEMHARESTKH
ncbi:MAG: hypothetical protein NTY48_04820 [Candidatus Diapherotrites archaeon]|nr:hypothetical protein [Candidatus Diapherotrites archaeon]